MNTPPPKNGKLLGVLGALALGAAAVMAIKHRRDGEEEETGSVMGDGEGEKYLKRISEDDLETLILEARRQVFSVKTDVGKGRKSDRLVRKIPGNGVEDCEGVPVAEEILEERAATPEETKMFEECVEDVARERAESLTPSSDDT